MNNETITMRLSPELKKEITKLAKEDERTISSYVRYVLIKFIKNNG
jgi:predicted DNA-binding protein